MAVMEEEPALVVDVLITAGSGTADLGQVVSLLDKTVVKIPLLAKRET